MISVRKSGDRGRFDHGWLDTRHTFSFGDYHDPDHMGFQSLRVLNDDRIAPGAGFPPHPHRDMEIVTVVLEGALEHRDDTGGGGVLHPGEIQWMTAGRGVVHSEGNASKTEPLHLYQIWILPERNGLEPRYRQVPADSPLRIHAGASVRLAKPPLTLAGVPHVWIQVTHGAMALNGRTLEEGDGASASGEPAIRLEGEGVALVFELS